MKVSIVTISYNQGRFLEDCLRSVLEQDYPDIEYIVIDAGSSDESLAIIDRYADKITKVIKEPDQGPADGLNKGFACATGDIYGFVNADDVLLPGGVSAIVAKFKASPKTDVVYGNGLELDAEGVQIQRVWSTPWNVKAHAYRAGVTVQPATFFTAESFLQVGGFNIKNRTCWDAELFVDMALKGARFAPLNAFVAAYRMYPGTVSSEVRWGGRGAIFEAENRRIFEKIIGRTPASRDRWIRTAYFMLKQVRQPMVAFEKLRTKIWGCKQLPPLPDTRFVWFGGYPAHYMGDFHRRLESRHEGLFFVYVPFGKDGRAFTHEQTRLPRKYVVLPHIGIYVQAWRWLQRLNPKAVLISGNYPRVNMLAAIWAKLHRRELYYLADSNLLDERNLTRSPVTQWILQEILRRTDRLLFIGSRNREFYLTQCGREFAGTHLHHLPLPHDHERFATPLKDVAAPFVFLSMGRLEEVKAVDRIIEAFAILVQRTNAPIRLLVAGDGPSRTALEKKAAALGIADVVEFRGSVPSDQTPSVFAESDAVVFASRNEPWGLVVNEALSSGKPVIGPFWIGAFSDLVRHGKNGLVTTGNGANELAEAMHRLQKYPALAREMGLAGRALVSDEGWTVEDSLASFERLIKPLEVSK